MTYTQERDEFIGLMVAEGVSVTVARKLLSAANTLQKLAELECSSERADRDRVPCPASVREGAPCLCDRFCKAHRWNFNNCSPACLPLEHSTVPRIARQSAQLERRTLDLCNQHGLSARFGGDPRGCVMLVAVPSGKTNDWGREGIAVPAKGFTAAQMERICR